MPGGGRWQVERSLYRNSLNSMLSHEKLNVTEAMMREKTLGQASLMGPEWEPAGIVSRKIAELINQRVPMPANGPKGMSSLASAGGSIMAQPSWESRQQQPQRVAPAMGRPCPMMQHDHQIEWQMMSRVSPHRGASVGAPSMPPTPMAASPSAPALLRYTDSRTPAAPVTINANALPRRMALGTKASPTLAWYPGLENMGKLGNNQNRTGGIPKR